MSKPTETIYSKDFAILKIKTLEKENIKLNNTMKEIRKYIKELLEYKSTNNVIHKDFVERIIDIINQDKRY